MTSLAPVPSTADLARYAQIHAASFTHPRPWSADELSQMLEVRGTFLLGQEAGFVMGRVILDEVELLTIAVDPAARRAGIGAKLLAAFEAEARQRGAAFAHLEVAADNVAAQALYLAADWALTGRRRGYYRDKEGKPVDALTLSRNFASGLA